MPIKSRLSFEQLQKIHFGAQDSINFPTQTNLAKHVGISRTTLMSHLKELVASGHISPQNHLLVKKHGGLNSSVSTRVRERSMKMRKYLLKAIRTGKKVSINDLQRLFGGEKRQARAIIEEVSLRKPILRKTVSDQPKRI